MALFDVPGWTVPSTSPLDASNANRTSKKRKRPESTQDSSASSAKLQAAELNIEKVLQKLSKKAGGIGESDTAPNVDFGPSSSKKKKSKDKSKGKDNGEDGEGQDKKKKKDLLNWREDKKKDKKEKEREKKKKSISGPKKLNGRRSTEGINSNGDGDGDGDRDSLASSKPPAKKVRFDEPTVSSQPEQPQQPVKIPKRKKSEDDSGLTRLQKEMKESLDGARFRLINESLYKSESSEAVRMMKENPQTFEEYHTGFRHQTESWPSNPVTHYINTLSTYPPRTCIADLGCGDAALARALVPRGLAVCSYDLVSDGAFVVEADICSHVPLPGSEGSEFEEPGEVGEGEGGKKKKSNGEGQVVDVVVCALSLMGTNWPGCMKEAWRILKADGELKIAEVASRFTDVKQFVTLISSIGFKLKSKDESNSHFTLFEFVKVPRKLKEEKEWERVMQMGSMLKPCEYKRR